MLVRGPTLLIMLLLFAFPIVMLIDCIGNKQLRWQYKLIWSIVILFPIYSMPLGSLVYGIFRLYQIIKSRSISRSSPPSQTPETFPLHDQRYQSQESSQSSLSLPQEEFPHEQSTPIVYEEPRATYPEMKHEE
jgi:hypothetical protein